MFQNEGKPIKEIILLSGCNQLFIPKRMIKKIKFYNTQVIEYYDYNAKRGKMYYDIFNVDGFKLFLRKKKVKKGFLCHLRNLMKISIVYVKYEDEAVEKYCLLNGRLSLESKDIYSFIIKEFESTIRIYVRDVFNEEY